MVGCPLQRLSSGAALICAAAPSLWVCASFCAPIDGQSRESGWPLAFPSKAESHASRASRRGPHRFKTCSQHGIAGSILRRRLLSASALPAPSEPASATGLCRCQTHMGQPIFAAARARARLWQPRRNEHPAGPPALLTLRKRAQASTRPKARDSPGNWLFLKGDEPASRSTKRPVLK